ncbi:30S ribosome-binding factor RbfA [Ectothiorhodospiraceae bacterium WFHF3C12]|nr:30S ribosome-binding factor RbfA [Ectothiorhodospiraceae bacterium WFHF3C12]
MPRDFPRTRRVAEQLQRELAELIRREIRDPRVGNMTVAEVRVSRNLEHADVYVTALGATAEDSEESVAALNHAAGYLRRQLGQMLKLRAIPALRFHYDASFDRGAHLSRLIDEAVAEDQEKGEGDG